MSNPSSRGATNCTTDLKTTNSPLDMAAVGLSLQWLWQLRQLLWPSINRYYIYHKDECALGHGGCGRWQGRRIGSSGIR